MDRTSRDTRKLIEELRSAVDQARQTRETTQRLLQRTDRSPAQASSEANKQPVADRSRLLRIARW